MRSQKIGIMFPLTILIALFTMVDAKCFADSTKQLAAKDPPYERHNYREECSDFSMRIRRFSDKLNESNLKIFCEKFNNDQREKAIQLANQKDKKGNFMMTPDEAVEKIAEENM